jgi:hypothetical protein
MWLRSDELYEQVGSEGADLYLAPADLCSAPVGPRPQVGTEGPVVLSIKNQNKSNQTSEHRLHTTCKHFHFSSRPAASLRAGGVRGRRGARVPRRLHRAAPRRAARRLLRRGRRRRRRPEPGQRRELPQLHRAPAGRAGRRRGARAGGVRAQRVHAVQDVARVHLPPRLRPQRRHAGGGLRARDAPRCDITMQ